MPWLLRVAGRRALLLVVGLCALNAVSALLSVSLAPIMQRAVDAATGGDAAGFRGLAALFAGVVAVQIALRAWIRREVELARAVLENRLRSRALADVLALPAREAERRHSADLMSRMTSDVQVVTEGVATLLPSLVSMGIRLVGVLAVMCVIAPGLALAFMDVGAVCIGVSAALRRELRCRHAAVQDAESAARRFIQECLESLLVVRAFGVGDKMRSLADALMGEHLDARMRRMSVSNLGSTGFAVVIQGAYVAGFIWCGHGILAGTLGYGTLVAVIQLVGQLQSPIAGLGGSFSRWTQTMASAERLRAVGEPGGETAVSAAADVPPSSPVGAMPAMDGARGPVPIRVPTSSTSPSRVSVRSLDEVRRGLSAIRFEGVSFAYGPDGPALAGVDARIPAGSFTAIAGPSGAGKSTLMKLLLAAYEPASGRVVLEGRCPGGAAWELVPAGAPQGLFAYVPQGNRLMAGTVREAVAFAERGAEPDADRVDRALYAACAEEFVAALPQGLDTPLGERGAGLSEGQTQRIAVARAVYSGAPVLLLDEATSALDAATEARMMGRLREIPGATVVIVTHRPEVMALCDQVVRLG